MSKLLVDHLTRRYGHFTALDDVSFDIAEGEIVGLLGPNGSGKTTLLRIISTYLMPNGGRVEVDGMDVTRDPLEIKKHLGYLPESNILYEAMRVDHFLRFVGEAKGLFGARLQERFEWCVEHCELGLMLLKKCGECSRGMRQRIALAAALIHDPPVLLLDEPTAGLDPLQSQTFRQLIASLTPGRVILFSSHLMAEVAVTTRRVLLIHQGRLLADQMLTPELARAEGLEQFFLQTIAQKALP